MGQECRDTLGSSWAAVSVLGGLLVSIRGNDAGREPFGGVPPAQARPIADGSIETPISLKRDGSQASAVPKDIYWRRQVEENSWRGGVEGWAFEARP